MDKQETLQRIRCSLSWKHYFNPNDVMDAVVLDNNSELLRKVRACQALLDAEYSAKEQVMLNGDEATCNECCCTFRKPDIDVSSL